MSSCPITADGLHSTPLHPPLGGNVYPCVSLCTTCRLIASQLIGYGLAGLARDYLVYPTWAVYPFLMPQVQLFDAMHRGKGVFLQRKRRIFFWAVLVGIFVWEWFPEYIAPTLTGISIFCLAAQHSAWVTRYVWSPTTAADGR